MCVCVCVCVCVCACVCVWSCREKKEEERERFTLSPLPLPFSSMLESSRNQTACIECMNWEWERVSVSEREGGKKNDDETHLFVSP